MKRIGEWSTLALAIALMFAAFRYITRDAIAWPEWHSDFWALWFAGFGSFAAAAVAIWVVLRERDERSRSEKAKLAHLVRQAGLLLNRLAVLADANRVEVTIARNHEFEELRHFGRQIDVSALGDLEAASLFQVLRLLARMKGATDQHGSTAMPIARLARIYRVGVKVIERHSVRVGVAGAGKAKDAAAAESTV